MKLFLCLVIFILSMMLIYSAFAKPSNDPPERPMVKDAPQADVIPNPRRYCEPRDTLLPKMRERWGEVPVTRALSITGLLTETLASSRGTWTSLVTGANGISCLTGAGGGWHLVKPGVHVPGPTGLRL